MAAINKVTERKMNGSRSEIFATEAARSECFLVFWFVFFLQIVKRWWEKEVDLTGFSCGFAARPCLLGLHAHACLHVFVHTQDGGHGVEGVGTGGFCWMSHIVPVRPGDIAGGQSGMEPERGDSDK